MSGRTRFNLAVAAAAVVAVVAVAVGTGGIDLGGGDGKEAAEPRPTTDHRRPATVPRRSERKATPLPENPDDLPGSDPRALTRAVNLRRALAELERRRARREGVFDSLRVAPGRIDTVIKTRDKRLNLQVRPDLSIPFESESEFPNDSDPEWRRKGLGAREVDPSVPERMLRAIQRTRPGDAAREIDYFVISRDIIDRDIDYGAYFNKGARPRIVLLEDGRLRAVG